MDMDAASPDAVKQPYDRLRRYAGWLDRDRTSAIVRTDVDALGVALDAGDNPEALLQTLDANLARLPGGELRKMLRAAAREIRRVLDDQR
jgi:hypothetical protein